MPSRWLGLPLVALVLAAVLAPTGGAAAEEAAEGESCEAWDVDYALSARLQLSDTPMGAGNGIYTIGPGSSTLRFANVGGQPGGAVRMRAYAMREYFEIESRVLFLKTHVLTDTSTTAAPDRCGDIARGELKGQTLRWATSLSGYRTDGTLTCTGSLCGSFGAPPAGRSELHIPPHPVGFSAFQFAGDMKTFTMGSTFVSKTDNPQQTAHITIAGREMRRTCVRAVPSCP